MANARSGSALISILAAALLAASCGGTGSRVGEVRTRVPAAATSSNASSSDSWRNLGASIVANRQNVNAVVPPDGWFGPYLSQPLNVTGNGDYSVTIGPLSQLDAGKSVVMTISLPGDLTFSANPSHELVTFKGGDGQTYGKFALQVTNYKTEYDGLTVWTQ